VVVASLRALMTQIVDYAGLFPPASLPLDQAVRNYARYRHAPEAWMLGRFICPATRLVELAPFVALFRSTPKFACSVLGRAVQSAAELVEGFRSDIVSIKTFTKEHGEHVSIDAYEVRLPTEITQGDSDQMSELFHQMRQSLPIALAPLAMWYEVSFGTNWRQALARLVPRMQGRGGIKIRCGGQDAGAFPTVEQLAFAITTCQDAGVPMKFTAGLHHPIRRFDSGIQANMHGFLNVFGAGVLAEARRLSEAEVQSILADDAPDHFTFDDEGLRWRELRATTKEIATARQNLATSFGSCSFDEPREDLRTLGLLP
jgi:hypothetical protein